MRAEHLRLQRLPVGRVGLGDGDEVAAEEHARDAAAARTARWPAGCARRRGGGEIGRAGAHDVAARQEFQRGGVGRAFGLDEHGPASRCAC